MTSPLTQAIARTILNGFERHIHLFLQITRSAKERFEQADWQGVQHAAKARTDYFDLRVEETLSSLKNDFAISSLNEKLWQDVKAFYIQLLQTHPQAELAESFYNSVFCHLFERRYFHNSFIFVESCLAIESATEEIYTCYQLQPQTVKQTIISALQSFNFDSSFPNLDQEIELLVQKFVELKADSPIHWRNLQLHLLNFVFYRNKGAYLIGKISSGEHFTPFIISIVHRQPHALHIDALVTDTEQMAVIFGFARAYFFVDCPYPTALVNFLKALIPHKSRADLYSSIGFHKQGKTQFYRDFLEHLENSDDQFVLAEGIKGMVMSVFTLPSYPYVFKIIKDEFSPSKQVTKQDVKDKYRLVKLHDRVGRMADTMEYSHVAFPKNRFSTELLTELQQVASSNIVQEDDLIVIRHLYIERRMTPLNLYLASANKKEVEQAMYGYGEAIKQLIAANIFPGDMLLKNFGVTRHGRVIFYDYDEISYMHQVQFRDKPQPETEDQIYASEPWYSIEPGDVFPEELATFALANPVYRQAFIQHHENLLSAAYWQEQQTNIKKGLFPDVFPYPDTYKLQPVQLASNN